jgi:hypothetical protein
MGFRWEVRLSWSASEPGDFGILALYRAKAPVENKNIKHLF